MAALLTRCGWICQSGGEWLSPKAVRSMYGIASDKAGTTKLSMQLARFSGQFPTKRGPSGRILEMQLTEKLSAYLQRLNQTERK